LAVVKIISVVGARPNFMKAAPVMRALREQMECELRLVHTDQHYDDKLSAVFFDELGLPRPDIHLGVGSGSHAWQTAEIMVRLEKVLEEAKPSLVLVYGDVNSTLATSVVAAKMNIPVAHVEAGLRSFDRTMPEELNRIVTDHLCEYLFTTEPSARKNLLKEGIPEEKIFFVGNVMVDTLLEHRARAQKINSSQKLGLSPRGYALLTLHRPSNVDVRETLEGIMEAVSEIAKELPVVFPCHPRTRPHLNQLLTKLNGPNGMNENRVIITDPLGYLEFLSLMIDARLVLTDSGGIQEETTVLGIPCLTLRDNTERPVTIELGTNVLVGTGRERILAAARKALTSRLSEGRVPDLWDGKAAERIARTLADHLP
jgi:UDP-N-acetylglucosamine 2-epimerase (non-hydrolysing)